MTEDEKFIEIPIKLGEGFTKILLDFNERINKLAEFIATLNAQDEQLIKLICKLHNLDLKIIEQEVQSLTSTAKREVAEK